jgi:hypothetical protein
LCYYWCNKTRGEKQVRGVQSLYEGETDLGCIRHTIEHIGT